MKKLLLVVSLLFVIGCDGIVITTDEDKQLQTEKQTEQNLCPQHPNCDLPQYQALVKDSVPYLDLPNEFRVRNYAGGSCVHASIGTLFYWQGYPEMAKWWNNNYSGGEYADRLHVRLDTAGIRFAYTKNGDWKFLQKCVDLRLGCAVNYPSRHMVTLVGLDKDFVYIVDNNRVNTVLKVNRSDFARVWSGWAVTIVYTPPPPEPYL